MKHYTIYEITEMLKEWEWSRTIFEIPADLYHINSLKLDSVDANIGLNMIHEKWLELNEETLFFIINEGEIRDRSEFPYTLNYTVEIGITNPAIEEFNLNRNIVT